MTETPETDAAMAKEIRIWAMACHLSALVGLLGNGIGFVLGPLVVWLVKREDHPFIDEHGKEALNFQITMFIAFFVAALSIFLLIGFVLLPLLAILDIVLVIVASIKTSNGERYRYPFCVRLIR